MSYIIHCFRWYKYFDHQLAPIYLGFYVCVLFSFLLLQKQLVLEQKREHCFHFIKWLSMYSANNILIYLVSYFCISFTLLEVYLVLLYYEFSNGNKYKFSIYFLIFISSVIFKINKWKYICFVYFSVLFLDFTFAIRFILYLFYDNHGPVLL